MHTMHHVVMASRVQCSLAWMTVQDDAKQGLVEFLEENSIDLVITGSATTSRFRKTLNVRMVVDTAAERTCIFPQKLCACSALCIPVR